MRWQLAHRLIRRSMILAFAAPLSTGSLFAQELLRISEQSLREQASKKVMPRYPKASVAAGKEGVAVALIEAHPDGAVEKIEILQAPDESIAGAVREALTQWRVEELSVVGSPKRYKSQGKVTFYFRIVAGRGIVLEPDQMPRNESIFAPPPTKGTRATSLGPTAQPRARRPPIAEIGQVELAALKNKDRVVVLDLRDRKEFARGHSNGSLNVPYDELYVRARAEIDPGVVVVLDSSYGEPSMISTGARLLQGMGFERIRVFIP